MEVFNEEWWPLVSNIWTKWDSYKYVNGDIRKTFACHFMKHRESSTRQKENVLNEKRRITRIRPSNICSAMIKIFWIASSNVVQVERHKNSPNHTHSLSEIDRLKRPKAIRSLVEIEAAKNYPPPAITSAVKEYATLELDLGECARELKRKEVTNIKYKIRGPTETRFIGNSNLKSDILESVSFLTEQGYLVENFRVSQRSTKGTVFAHPEQLKKLERHGWLTLIDSTHKTNRNEDADTVAEALTIIRNNNIEAKSIKKTFPGIAAGEQECQVLLCVVHVMRTWMQKIHEKKTRDIMIAAMHKRTKIGCESLVQDAINSCPVPSIQSYIKRNYTKNTEKWGLWARQHSPLLLQVTSTNSLESFHSELKKTTSSSHGLIGAAHKVVNVDCKKRSEAESASFDFRIKKISAYGVDGDILEEIQKFPFPFQQLIIREACAVINRLEKGKSTPGLTSLDCFCLFRHRYLLPCKHIFHEHMYGNKLLTTDVWQMFREIFEESGFEVYESRESFIEYVQTEQQKNAENRRIAVGELTERMRDRYWRVEEMGDVEKTQSFISMLEASMNPIILQFDNNSSGKT
uniref:MULE transposase domain-containing protein n=1 Tax=Rhizophagus irregularis (strain DAOM 181602 / DAOM 197198 / MUCL 43194) TaxID=747089 RepID=U9TK48_RHIID